MGTDRGFRCRGQRDVDVFQDRNRVEQVDVLRRLLPGRLFECVEFGGPGGAFGFESVESA
jgi:hypothetical protein